MFSQLFVHYHNTGFWLDRPVSVLVTVIDLLFNRQPITAVEPIFVSRAAERNHFHSVCSSV